jgi:hypothetical protein
MLLAKVARRAFYQRPSTSPSLWLDLSIILVVNITTKLSEGRVKIISSLSWSHQSLFPLVEIVLVSAMTDVASKLQDVRDSNYHHFNLSLY